MGMFPGRKDILYDMFFFFYPNPTLSYFRSLLTEFKKMVSSVICFLIGKRVDGEGTAR
jgi:chromosome condensin MukBEF MukE localization factor